MEELEARLDEIAFLESLRQSLAFGFCRNLQTKIDRLGTAASGVSGQ
ncbi:hypothetical protein [Microvirga puerhi]|uniref:Uncharacterized protein n=1 Tax=Microvirga puerhi TaxID=2876078 RepID=A0ABS7VLF2_9HYPH|nr:hypothetical protein [Microvirga puerhi]MBZ6076346.1 hypothetical protein [Microvirga puerhi]